ncbi:hemagglutinin repeat-containing protein [Achromobacter xylosoxidans]|uniref:hemagglutinin repeat-containing protein n=1 Tax=Alcaligenes xylosoxydans xylosoxydans TaxID=85698 RepID=UPI0006C15C3B|nr:hemagglutinin repeat-containing protein [Achromobacter xylosoxidans]WOB73999.1 hemagglutinin repeat-containing protein [Achromobacter xylosoxidans]CUI92416.1 Uncharacterised protein [Achromobacter xylosoxidans]
MGGDLSIIGSDLAGRNVLLAATNDLMLQSQAETPTEVATSRNSGWKVWVGIGVSDSGKWIVATPNMSVFLLFVE